MRDISFMWEAEDPIVFRIDVNVIWVAKHNISNFNNSMGWHFYEYDTEKANLYKLWWYLLFRSSGVRIRFLWVPPLTRSSRFGDWMGPPVCSSIGIMAFNTFWNFSRLSYQKMSVHCQKSGLWKTLVFYFFKKAVFLIFIKHAAGAFLIRKRCDLYGNWQCFDWSPTGQNHWKLRPGPLSHCDNFLLLAILQVGSYHLYSISDVAFLVSGMVIIPFLVYW